MSFDSREVAERYQETLAPLMFLPSATRLVSGASLAAGNHVLDVATGTGVVARAAAEAVGASGRVVGVDSSEGMLAVARSQPQAPGAAPIEYIAAPIERAGLPAQGFDEVFCQQGLQFFDEPLQVLRNIARTLRPGGRLHIALWGAIEEHPLADALQRALLECGLDDLTWFLSKAHRLHDPALVTHMLQQAGFAVEQQERVEITPEGHWQVADLGRLLAATPLAAKLSTLTEEQREALRAASERNLAEYGRDGKLELRFHAMFYAARVA